MRILALTHRLPYAPNRGDRIRSYHLLRTLAGHADVHLVSFADRDDVRHVGSLETWLSSVTLTFPTRLRNLATAGLSLSGQRPLTHTLLSSPDAERLIARVADQVQPNVVLAYCSGMARFAVGGPLARIPCVLDMVDVDSLKWEALAKSASMPMAWLYRREARVLRRFEVYAASRASCVLVVNARERDSLAAIAPQARTVVIENGIDASHFAAPGPPSDTRGIVFCGVMDYQPNVDGVIWFVERVWPAVRAAVPDATFTVVGARPRRSIVQLAKLPGIRVTGEVADVRPFLWDAAVSVAPLMTARGIQNKVLEALAAGLPVVTTGTVADGLPQSVLPGCCISDDPAGWIASLVKLLDATAADRRRLNGRADLASLTWESRLNDVQSIFERAKMEPRPS
jgi:sugar transferase (PEP-CTERM/EpsH1 system associated)